MIEKNLLAKYNARGIIPGPDEDEEHFLKRAEVCLNFKKEMDNSIPHPKISLEKFDVSPDWVPILKSNDKLTPWQGGCTWIVQLEENAPQTAFIQLRKKIFGLYSEEEILQHEFAHVGRLEFDEPKYEEYFAYATSPSKFRRFFGPIIQSSKESFFFFVICLLIFLSDLSLIVLGEDRLFVQLMWLKLIPLGMIILAIIRLILRHRTLNQCLKRVSAPIAYRLTDHEIAKFSRWEPNKIEEYVETQKNTSLRWRIIFESYLKKNNML